MLKKLYIKDYALIDELSVNLGPGLNILTWETGTGKSIIIGALSLLLGERTNIADLIPRFNIFVLSSSSEGLSNTILEAMASGVPVVATNVGGNPEVVRNGVTGYLVDPRDVDHIASKMAVFLDAPENAELLGARGQEHVRKYFLLPELIRRYLIILRYYTNVDRRMPDFRLNDLTYSEVISVVRDKHLYLYSQRNLRPDWTRVF